MTPEQKQLEQIRERWSVKTSNTKSWGERPTLQSVGGIKGAMEDIYFLLSLVKSQEAKLMQVEQERNALSLALKNELTTMTQPAATHRDYDCMTTIADETLWCATCAAHAEYLRGRSDAATAMRSACVEKVKAIRDNWAADEIVRDCGSPINALNEAITELESLSIEQSKE